MQNLRKYVKLLNRKHKTEMEYKWGLVSIIPALSLCTMIESIEKKNRKGSDNFKVEKRVTFTCWFNCIKYIWSLWSWYSLRGR